MALCTSEQLLAQAQKDGYAVGAFNVENMEMLQAVIAAGEEMQAPVIIQTTPSTVRYGTLQSFSGMAGKLAAIAKVPVVLHLDHGDSFELAVRAMKEGYSSVMIDGSHFEFEKNIELTKSVVAVAKACGVPVEAELGKVGGKEDDIDGGDGGYTVPEDAKIFAECTGISSLAVAIGTAHGLYKGKPNLDFSRLAEIRKLVEIPLVLHGGTGIPNDDIQKCIELGICKVNFATELRIAYSDGVKEALADNPTIFDPKSFGKAGFESVKKLVKAKILICGSDNKIRR